MNKFDKLKILLQIAGKKNVVNKIEQFQGKLQWIENLSFLRKALKKNPILKGDYKFGKKNKGRVSHSLADELVNLITESMHSNRRRNINPNLNIGWSTRFGANDNWGLGLNLNKNNPNFNIGARFGSEKNWGADLGINLGQNKGINFNIGRKF